MTCTVAHLNIAQSERTLDSRPIVRLQLHAGITGVAEAILGRYWESQTPLFLELGLDSFAVSPSEGPTIFRGRSRSPECHTLR
jgi:hypothetical protein